MTAPTNASRAARAKGTVGAWVDLAGGGYDLSCTNGVVEAISDMLTDLRHYCVELGVDFNTYEHQSWINYVNEAAESGA